MSNLVDLPTELLTHILRHIETAKDLSSFSLACKKLRELVARDGFRVFVQHRFSSFPVYASGDENVHGFWEDAAHALATLSRNLRRKALLARFIGPAAVHRPRPGQRGNGQTMGFTPVIDSHEVWHGSDWSSREQIISWGAGARLIFGFRDLTRHFDAQSDGSAIVRKQIKWVGYHEEGAIDGRDDITSVQLIATADHQTQNLLIGRANGDLARVSFDRSQRKFNRLATFNTKGQPIRSAAASAGGLLATCLSDRTLALYDTRNENPEILSDHSIDVVSPSTSGRTWAIQFLRHDRLAVGLGPSARPVKILDLKPNAANDTIASRREIAFDAKRPGNAKTGVTAVYSLAPLCASSVAGVSEGNLFLSGGYDGACRLHDLRCADSVSATFEDPVDFSPIYSLITFGHERFIAGGASNSLIKVFDLRLPGSKRYYAMDVQKCSDEGTDGWNVFLGQGANQSRRGRSDADSPVYSLSKPSELSPTFFAGIENRVLQIDLFSIMDKYPDPVHDSFVNKSNAIPNHKDVHNLPMYQHPSDNEPVKLRTQRRIGRYDGTIQGWDERWTTAEGDRTRLM